MPFQPDPFPEVRDPQAEARRRRNRKRIGWAVGGVAGTWFAIALVIDTVHNPPRTGTRIVGHVAVIPATSTTVATSTPASAVPVAAHAPKHPVPTLPTTHTTHTTAAVSACDALETWSADPSGVGTAVTVWGDGNSTSATVTLHRKGGTEATQTADVMPGTGAIHSFQFGDDPAAVARVTLTRGGATSP